MSRQVRLSQKAQMDMHFLNRCGDAVEQCLKQEPTLRTTEDLGYLLYNWMISPEGFRVGIMRNTCVFFREHNLKLRRGGIKMPRAPDSVYSAIASFLCEFAREDPEWLALTIHGMFKIGEAKRGDRVRNTTFDVGGDGEAKMVDIPPEQQRLFDLYHQLVLLPEVGYSGLYSADYDISIAMTLAMVPIVLEGQRRLMQQHRQAQSQMTVVTEATESSPSSSTASSLTTTTTEATPTPIEKPVPVQQQEQPEQQLTPAKQQEEKKRIQRDDCVCGKPGSKVCGGCRVTKYCSAECQKADWPKHKLLCGKPVVPVQQTQIVPREQYKDAERELLGSSRSTSGRHDRDDAFHGYSGHARDEDIELSKLLAVLGLSGDSSGESSSGETKTKKKKNNKGKKGKRR
eukprot:TRINITY_DN1246_c0_g1_i1.p1 TRINITY_DN1246_c0_g1~~TRINITY_DN1246_c0_g1_i1.p1  ORF type:complete len:430 (-),score=91.53 TRINITY_DN1246_c0_g1_i1:978-2177(-)